MVGFGEYVVELLDYSSDFWSVIGPCYFSSSLKSLLHFSFVAMLKKGFDGLCNSIFEPFFQHLKTFLSHHKVN